MEDSCCFDMDIYGYIWIVLVGYCNNSIFVKSICLKLRDTDIDVTFTLTCELSFVVSTSTGTDRSSGRSAAALCVFIRRLGYVPLCVFCVGWKMSLHRGICLLWTTFKENPHSRNITGNAQRMLKRPKYEARTRRMHCVCFHDCFKLPLSLIHANVMKPSATI